MIRFLSFFLFLLIFQNIFSQNINDLNQYLFNSQFSEAIQTGENLIKQDPDNADIYYKCGLACQMLNKYRQAENYIEKAYSLDSLNTKIINAYADISDMNQNKRQAISLYRKTLAIDSTNYTALNNLAKLFFSDKKYDAADSLYRKLSKQDSFNSYYYRKIGLCKIKQNNIKTAVSFYYKAYMADSTDNINIKSLATVYLKLKLFDKAIETCKKGIKNDSLFPDFYKTEGDVHFAKNHYYRSVPLYKKTLSLGDSSYNVNKRLGISLCETKKYNEALRYNLAVYKVDSVSYSNTLYLCRTYLGLKDYDTALEYAEKTLKLLRFAKTISYDIYDDMASAYIEKKQYKNAITMYQKRISTFEKASDRFRLYDFYQIALTYDKLNDKKNALKYYEKVIKIIKNRPTFDKENPWYKYANQRITKIKEDIFFESN